MEYIIHVLNNSGFHVLGQDGAYLVLEDPACFVRSLETFLDFAWIAVSAMTALMLFGWGISFIRAGSASPIVKNLRNLTLMFGILAAAPAAVNAIWGGDLFNAMCAQIRVPISELQRVLDAQKSTLQTRPDDALFEEYDIWDSESGTQYMADMNSANIDWSNSFETSGAGNPPMLSGVQVTTGPTRIGAAAALSMESGNNVIYTSSSGGKYMKTGGTRSWRNNNPGNMRYTDFSRRRGAIGQAGGFAVFPDQNTGMQAAKMLLTTRTYSRLTVGGAISRWAPPSENNTAGYQRRLEQLTGIPIDTPISQLSDAQIERVAMAIKQIEGWRPGKEAGLAQ